MSSVRRYQIVLLGPEAPSDRDWILNRLENRVKELSDTLWAHIDILEGASVGDFDIKAPVVGVWSGSPRPSNSTDLTTLDSLLSAAKPILPLVRATANFNAQTPTQLHPVNGLSLNGSDGQRDRAVNTILEVLQLLRRRRRLFISYARKDSRAAARQLFGSLAERGFDVFLDTHSIPAATFFQNQLWHSMVDSDLVVLLDSNGVDNSHWCRAEYERADALSIGVVRLLWPDRKVDPSTDALQFSLMVPLAASDFRSGSRAPSQSDELTDAAVDKIAETVEGFRARSIAARQANLITTFQREAAAKSITTTVQPNLHVTVQKPAKKIIAIVPTVGVPISTNYHDAFMEYEADPPDVGAQVILYNRQGFLPSWVDHLTWLNTKLPVTGIDVTEVPAWLSTL